MRNSGNGTLIRTITWEDGTSQTWRGAYEQAGIDARKEKILDCKNHSKATLYISDVYSAHQYDVTVY